MVIDLFHPGITDLTGLQNLEGPNSEKVGGPNFFQRTQLWQKLEDLTFFKKLGPRIFVMSNADTFSCFLLRKPWAFELGPNSPTVAIRVRKSRDLKRFSFGESILKKLEDPTLKNLEDPTLQKVGGPYFFKKLGPRNFWHVKHGHLLVFSSPKTVSFRIRI